MQHRNSLALVGGNVSLDAPDLLAPGGRVELGGLSAAGTVGLNADGSLSFPVGVQRGDVSLTNQARVDVSAGGGGSIVVNARNLDISGGSGLYAGIRQGSGTVASQAGDIKLDATGDIKVVGSYVFNDVESQATGNSGNINITTGSFSLSDGAVLRTGTSGQGNAGSVFLQAKDSVSITGSDTRINTAVLSSGVGKGGDINIRAASLSIKDGAQLQSAIFTTYDETQSGRGDAGNVKIDVTGPVTISGIKDESETGIFSLVSSGGVGNGGNIAISSGSFSLSDGAVLTADTSGQGNAGNVSVRASNFVFLGSNTAISSTVSSPAVGNGGNININAPRVSLNDGAGIIASSAGNGAAGDIKVLASSIRLDNGSAIKANTVAGQGNINLRASDYVLLRHGSKITTDATGKAGGGNIKINTGSLAAVPWEDSDITANAQEGLGGQINIKASSSFGIQFRQKPTDFSDITASSAKGSQFSGRVKIDILDNDPSKGLFKLTESTPDPAQQIAQNPCIKGFGSTFTITGRGGLPTDPNKVLSSDNVRVDLIQPVTSTVSSTTATKKQPSKKPPVKQIIPAQGWIYNEKGQVVLVGYDPTKTGPQRQQPAPTSNCAAVK